MSVRVKRVLGSRLVAVSIGALLMSGVGIAWATIPDAGGIIHGCYQTESGQLRLLDAQSKGCKNNEVAVSWNAQGEKGDQGIPGIPGIPGINGKDGTNGTNGTNGTDGTKGATGPKGADGINGTDGTNGRSVSSIALAPGDANCPTGGTQFTSSTGPSYACNGARGPQGDTGTFTGMLQSPNGAYSLSLTNSGAVLSGPTGTVKISGTSVDIVGPGGSVHVTPGGTAVVGTLVTINGCNAPVARLGDGITGDWIWPHGLGLTGLGTGTEIPYYGFVGPAVAGTINAGSPTVCTG